MEAKTATSTLLKQSGCAATRSNIKKAAPPRARLSFPSATFIPLEEKDKRRNVSPVARFLFFSSSEIPFLPVKLFFSVFCFWHTTSDVFFRLFCFFFPRTSLLKKSLINPCRLSLTLAARYPVARMQRYLKQSTRQREGERPPAVPGALFSRPRSSPPLYFFCCPFAPPCRPPGRRRLSLSLSLYFFCCLFAPPFFCVPRLPSMAHSNSPFSPNKTQR